MKSPQVAVLLFQLCLFFCFSDHASANTLSSQEETPAVAPSFQEQNDNYIECTPSNNQGYNSNKGPGAKHDKKCKKKWHCGRTVKSDKKGCRKCKRIKTRLCTSSSKINWGESVKLRWTCRRTASCELEPINESLDPNGSGVIIVSPKKTTKYTLIGKKSGCVVKSTVKIKVLNIPPPTVTFSASPEVIKFGEETTLSWQTTNADSVYIEPGVGSVEKNGSVSVPIFEEKTFTITAKGPGGTATSSVTVDATDKPPPGLYYKYDELGRLKHIIRIPAQQAH